MSVKRLNNCLCCDSTNLNTFFDLGNQPLANNLKKSPFDTYQLYPLAVNVCESCFHVQLTHVVDPKLMFEDYLYVSGTTQTLQQYFKWFSDFVVTECAPKTILDIGCNDGSQLNYFKSNGVKTFGIDPAKNLTDIATNAGHIIHTAFFDKDYIHTGSKFDCIIAQNVFAHNSDPYNFLLKCESMLEENGTLYIQVSQVDMILNNEFDTIYHEHVSFFNINSINVLLERTNKLYLVDVIKTPIHGNSYIFGIKKQPRNWYRIANLIKSEAKLGLYNLRTYLKFAENINIIKYNLHKKIKEFTSGGRLKLIGYGAAAKGMTALNYFGINFTYIIDDNELKCGKYTHVNNTPIVSIEQLKNESKTDMLVFIPLAWNFFAEIKKRVLEIRPNSSKYDTFIEYFPEVKVSII